MSDFFVLSTTVYAQDDVLKVTLRVGKHQNFYRFVFICEKPGIIHSINVNLLNNGKIKLTFPESFEIEFEGYRAICANKLMANSQLFDSVWDSDRHDLMIQFGIRKMVYGQ